MFPILGSFDEWIFAEITGDRPRQPAYAVARLISISSDFLFQLHTQHAGKLSMRKTKGFQFLGNFVRDIA